MKVYRVQFSPSKRYPYTHRMEFKDYLHGVEVLNWINENSIPGTWIQSANCFYTTAKYATIMSLKWSHE